MAEAARINDEGFDETEIFVGKDVLELLSSSMYVKAVDAQATKAEGDIFESLPASKRATYKEVFDLIYDCSVNQVAAKSLIDRLLDRLSRT